MQQHNIPPVNVNQVEVINATKDVFIVNPNYMCISEQFWLSYCSEYVVYFKRRVCF